MNNRLDQIKVGKLNELVKLVEPDSSDLHLTAWAQTHRDATDEVLHNSPAVLFRGFRCGSLVEFCSVFSEPMDYMYRSTPRTELKSGLYTATEYPREVEIPQHCENAYQNSWPLKLYFHCEQAAERGGETPLGDIRAITADIPREIKERFRKEKVMYVRNYSPGLDISWQTVFQTSDRHTVERYCRENAIEYEWKANDSLRTRQVCQGMALHPITGEELWFNQAHLFHISNLEQDIRSYLLQTRSEEDLPRNAYYGNGQTIEDEVLMAIRNAFSKYKYTFSWQDGDVLLIDNMLCSHGRNPFTGKRKVYVSMSNPVTCQT